MKKVLALLVSLTLFSMVNGQQRFFVYLESAEAFFVKLDDRTYSSGSSGYVILPSMSDSSYRLRIGFPQNKYPDQDFRLVIAGRDHGFQLQNKGANGFALFEQQTGESIANEKGKVTFRSEPRSVSHFTDVLSRATDDPSLLYTTIRITPAKAPPLSEAANNVADAGSGFVKATAPDTTLVTAPVVMPASDSAAVARKTPAPGNDSVLVSTAVAMPAKNAATIARETQAPGKDSVLVSAPVAVPAKDAATIARETPAAGKDSVLVSAPAAAKAASAQTDRPATGFRDGGSSSGTSPAGTETELPASAASAPAYKLSTVTKKGESSTTLGFGLTFVDEYDGHRDTIKILIPPPGRQVVFSDSRSATRAGSDATVPGSQPASTGNAEPVFMPVNCKSGVSDAEVAKARRKMNAASDEDAMLHETSRLIRSKCITTDQLRELSAAFPGDGGKFKLFRLAKAKISDPAAFTTLEKELHDAYFIGQFRNLPQ